MVNNTSRLVIIGGGFAGSKIAQSLESEFKVTLIDTKDYFEFTPSILRTLVRPSHARRIQRKHNDYLKDAKVVVGRVNEVAKKFVVVNKKRVFFDYLVICSGSTYASPIKEENVVIASRTKHLLRANKDLEFAKEVLLVGGGLVGVELAAEICTVFKDKKITLIHLDKRLAPRNTPKTSRIIQNFLEKRGVKIILGDAVEKTKNKVYTTRKGLNLSPDVCFLTVGITPNHYFMKKHFSSLLDKKGFVLVDKFLRVKGSKNIFAAGDINALSVEKTAQHAENQADVVIKNLRSLKKNKGLCEYTSKEKGKGMIISLGKYHGIFESGNFVISGFIPAFMKWFVEFFEMLKK